MSKRKKLLLRVFCIGIAVGMILTLALLLINAYVKSSVKDRIIESNEIAEGETADCILVLGCLVRSDGSPSDMLKDRLEQGIALYQAGIAPKILMSGDHGTAEYDEVNGMKQYAMDQGVPSEDVFMDHAGFSTYESIYRAKEVFGAKRIVIVTQEYHLYRALYVAEALGLDAVGVGSDPRTYRGQTARDLREVLARTKDFINGIFTPEPTYLGDSIDLNGNGNVTND